MSNPKGDFIWYELLTPDADAPQRFYGDVVGWTASDSGQPGMDYRILDAGDGLAGGLMQINDQMPGAKPVWLGYVAVPNVDAAVAAWTAAGGSVQMPAMDIPNVGRMAMLADPDGVPLYVMRGAVDASSTAFRVSDARHVEQGNLRCGYHGLLFNAGGLCIDIPGQEQIPPRASVRRYTVQEHDGVVWVWFGRDVASQPDQDPPRWPVMGDAAYRMRGAAFHYNAPWQLIHDNLMDLTHAGYVHAQTIGGNPRLHSEAPTEYTSEGNLVRVQRRLLNSPPPATFADVWPFEGGIDRWQQIEFHVSHVRIFAGGSNAGTEDIEKRAPETESTTHYFWMVGCNSPDEGAIKRVYDQFYATFVEDKVIIEAQHQNLQHFGDAPRISAHFDRAPTMVRRIVERLTAA